LLLLCTIQHKFNPAMKGLLMKQRAVLNIMVMLVALLTVPGRPLFAEDVKVASSYLYTLSNFTGIYPVSSAVLGVDESQNEIYVVTSTKVKIFNTDGMEIYGFNEGGELGMVLDVAVDSKTADIFVLASRAGQIELVRCNYRGEQMSTVELKNLPPAFSGFTPNRLAVLDNSIYLASTNDMRVVVTDNAGMFKKGYDIASLITEDLTEKEKEKEKQDAGLTGFSVDKQGNILFTNGVIARAFKLSSDGQMRSFGMRGSTAGKFGIPGDIVADATGNYILVADTLRCVVMIFDNDFKFHAEFGNFGFKPSNLIGPMYVAIDGKNRLYVSQLRNRGVNVYQITTS